MKNLGDLSDQVHQLLHEAERRGYERGYSEGIQDAKSKILAAIDGGATVSAPPLQAYEAKPPEQRESAEVGNRDQERQRAPRGLPRALATRVLRRSPDGATPQQIADAAETDFEKMIAVSSIRSELRRGQDDNRYLEVDGVWHLAEGVEAEDQDLTVQPSASDNDDNKGGESYAPAVTQ